MRLTTISAILSLLSIFLPGAPARGGAPEEPLTLRVNDARGRPGELTAVVVRTYAPRILGQGRICLRADTASELAAPAGRGTGAPLVELESFVVFSEAGDVISEGTFDEATQTALIDFESLSGTINQSDGPLAVLFFRISPSAEPGQIFRIAIDGGESFVTAPDGTGIAIEPRAGDLEIVSLLAPFELAADGGEAVAGELARLGVATSELFPIAFGRAAFVYDPEIAAGPPTVSMDPRHGQASFAVDDTVPGRVVVAFTSLDASLNSIPGDLVAIDLPIIPDAPIGLTSPISLDPARTFLASPTGALLPLELDGDVIEIVLGAALFSDGFESGDLSNWSGP